MRKIMFSGALAALVVGTMPRALAAGPFAAAKGSGSARTVARGAAAASGDGAKDDKLTPGTSDNIEASGAIVEPEILDRIDTDHPAVDNNPRAGQSVDQNRIDFNDPTKSDEQAVADNLNAQGIKTKAPEGEE